MSRTRGGRATPEINTSRLQAILLISVKDATSEVSISASDSDQPFLITFSIRQKWSANPTQPLTISTWRTPLDTSPELKFGGGSVRRHLRMLSITEPRRSLSVGPLPRHLRIHWADPYPADNWRDLMGFVTIPSYASGEELLVTRTLEREDLFSKTWAGTYNIPRPGEEFELGLDSDFYVEWWNWGDLEGDLKDKKFVVLPNPKYSDRDDPPPPDPYLLPYACWDDFEDDEGREMIYLQIDQSEETKRVKFVD